MKISKMMPSKYLKQADVEEDYIVTIRGVKVENVARDGDSEEMKYVIYFKEFDKGMVLNPTNMNLIANALNSDETDDWKGQEVVLYTDPSISYGGKVTGGLRIKANRVASPPRSPARVSDRVAAKSAPKRAYTENDPPPFGDMDDDIPFN
jgi:hypothetical protein